MARVLLSWIAHTHDFAEAPGGGRAVNTDGPTAGVHQHFWRYDRHLLLSQNVEGRGDPRVTALLGYLGRVHPGHAVEPVYLGVRDVIDVREIMEKVERVLAGLRGHEVEVYISPGTPAMQIAWYLLALGHPIRLFQVRPAQVSASGTAEQAYVEVERAPEAAALAIREEAPPAEGTPCLLYTSPSPRDS